MTDPEIVTLLTDIRNTQAQSLDLMKQALELQRGAVDQQSRSVSEQMRIGKIYRKVVVAGGVLIVFILGLIVFLVRLL